ncbi:hypothetical protein J5751_04990 [bacterium]|nr:hypothetical protein [bacterium]
MKKIIRTEQELIDVFKYLKALKKPIMMEFEKLTNKRSHKQLRSYWMLIKVCKLWMAEQGQHFTDEEVSYYFKIKAGFFNEFNGVKMAKSISDKSHCTKQEMENLINTILDFGAENGIEDCYIESQEMEELLKYYGN